MQIKQTHKMVIRLSSIQAIEGCLDEDSAEKKAIIKKDNE